LLVVVTQERQIFGITSLKFLQALILVDEGKPIHPPDTEALKPRKDHVKHRNLHIALEELRVITVAVVLRNNPGLSHDLGVSNGKNPCSGISSL
jgi:hypothetical protein